MADRYWVGDPFLTGTWNTTDTSNWSTTSGGAGGASVPTAADSVFFDQGGSYTVTMTGALTCLDLTVSAGTVTFAQGTSPTLTVSGNWSTIAATTWSMTGTITFNATTSKTIDFKYTIPAPASPITFNGVGGTWTLLSDLVTTATTTLTNGTLALSSYTLYCSIFSSSNSNTRTINFGTGKIWLNGTATNTIWNTGTVTNLTVSGTPSVLCTAGINQFGITATKTINTGALSEANAISFELNETDGTVTYAFTAGNTVKNLVINGNQTISNIAINIFGNFTHSTTNGTTTFTAGANAWTFAATSGSYNITNISGFTYDFPWTFGSATSTATWTIINNLTLGGSRQLTLTNGTTDFNNKTLSSGGITIVTGSATLSNTGGSTLSITTPITHTSGTLTLNTNLTTSSATGYTLNAGTLALGSNTLTTTIFSSSNSNVRAINFGTGKIVLNASTTTTIWNTSTNTNLTVSGTPLVECIGGGTGVTKTISCGTPTAANSFSFSLLETTGTASYTFTASQAIKSLTVNGSQTVNNTALTIYETFTHLTTSGTTTFTAGISEWTFAAASGSYTITNVSGFTYDFPWIFGPATASTATWTIANNLTLGATRQITLRNGTTDFNNKTLSAQGITILTGSPTIANTGGSGFTTTLPITHTSGTLTLTLNLTTSSLSGYTLTAGTLALGSNTLTTTIFSSSNSNVRAIDFGTGKIVLNGSATNTIWTTSNSTNLTISGTPLVESIGGGTSVTKTITPGTPTEANTISFSLLETTGTVSYVISTSHRVRNFTVNGSQTLSTFLDLNIYGNFTHLTTNGTTTFANAIGTNGFIFAATSGSYNITNIAGFTYDFTWTFGSATSTATWTIVNNLTLGATRNLTLVNGTTDFNNKTLSALGIIILTGSATLSNTGASTFSVTIPITHTSGTLTLNTNLTTSNASGYTLTAGTLALVSNTLTTTTFSSNNSNARTINFGTGKIVLNGSTTTTIWNTGTVTGLTVSGTPLVESIGGGTAVTKTINSGALSEANSISFSLLETTGTVTYTFTASNAVRNLIINGLQTISNIAISIFGSFTHLTSNGTTTFTAGANAWTFAATSGSYNITNVAGFTYDFPWTFGSSASTATWTIVNNLTLGATRTLTFNTGTLDFNNKTLTGSSGITKVTGTFTLNNTGGTTLSTTVAVTHTSGTLNLGTNLTTTAATGYTLTAGTLSLGTSTLTTPVFVSSGSTARTLAFGTGQLALTGNNATIFDVTTSTNFSTTGTIYINSTYTGSVGTRTFVTGFTFAQAAGYNIATTGTTGIVISSSATDIVALTGGFDNINLTGFIGTLSNTTRTIFGNLTLPSSGGTYTAGTNITTFGSTSGTETITTNGRTLDFPITFNGAGGTFQLLDSLTIGTTRTTTLTAGTLQLNNNVLTTGLFSSSNSNTRILNFGSSGQLALTANNATILDLTTTSGFDFAGTIYINCTYTGATGTRTIVSGLVEPDVFGFSVSTSGTTGIVLSSTATDIVALTGSFDTINLTGFIGTLSNTLRQINGNFTTPSSGGTYSAGTNPTVFVGPSGTQTITTNGRTLDFPITVEASGTVQLVGNLTIGSTRRATIVAGTLDLNNNTLSCFDFLGSSGFTRVISFGTSGIISVVGNNASIVDFTEMTNFTYTGTPRIYSTYTGATGTRTFNIGSTAGATATNIFDVSIGTSGTGIVIAAGTDSITLSGNYNIVNLSGLTMTLTNTARSIWGNLVIPSTGGTLTAGANITTFISPSSQTITTNGRTIDFPFTVGNGTSSGVTQLAGALTLGSTRTFTLTSGNFDLNNFTTTANVFVANGTASRTLSFSTSGQMTLVGSNTTIITMPTATGFGYTGTAKILSSYSAGTGTRTFALGNAAGFANSNVTFDFNINGSNGIIIAGGTDSLAVVGEVRDFDMRNSTNILTNTTRTVRGNFYTSSTGGTFTAGANITTLAGNSGSFTIDTANRSLDFPITFNGNGNYSLANNYICGVNNISSTRTVTLSTGNLSFNNVTLWCANFVANTSNIRSLNFNGTTGQMNLITNNTTVWNSNNGANFSLLGNYIINSIYTANVGTRVFDFGNISETYAPNVKITTGTTGFNIGTANDSVTLTGSIGTLDLTGLLATVTNTARTIYGNLIIPATGGTFTAGAVATTFGATTGIDTIDTNGRTLQFPLTFNGVGGNWTLANNLVANATTVLTLTNGQVDFNQKSLTFANITVLTGNAGLNNLSTSLNFVHTSGNLTILSGAINSSTTGTYTIAAGTLTTNSAFSTNAFTQNGGNVVLNGGDLTVPNYSGSTSTARSIDFANGNINVTSTGTVVNFAIATNMTANGNGNINITNTGSTAISVFPGNPTITGAVNYSFTGGTYALTLNDNSANIAVKNLNFTGYSGTVNNPNLTVFGSLLISTGMTLTAGTRPLTFAGTSNHTITSNGKTFDFPVTFNGVGGNYVLNDALTIGSTRLLTLSNGTIDLNNVTLSTGTFTATTGTKEILFDGGTLTVVGSGATAFNIANATGFTTTKGTGTGTISMTSSSAKTFVGNNATYNCYLDHNGLGDLTITGLNTFEGLKSTYANTTANANIILPAGNTTITANIIGGSANNKLLGLIGPNSASRANIVTANTSNQIANFVQTRSTIFISNVFPTDGSSPWRWYLQDSVNAGDTLGAVFANNNGTTGPILYFITTGTSFTIPNDWDSANNTIHLWGGGGGGGGGIAGDNSSGPGGGGGGYTKIDNFSIKPNSVVTYSIGAAGTAGPASTGVISTAGNGGQTSFSAWSANGGTGGISRDNGEGTAGTGGIGLTYNGGTGGLGRSASSTTGAGGGGGGGAGGPNGNGGTGGRGITSGTNGSIAGGGGGGYSGGTAGANAVAGTGGIGGNNFYGNGGGSASGANGNWGGGGAGGVGGTTGGRGSIGIDIFGTGAAAGGGGGGSGDSASPAISAFFIGAGGGGGSSNDNTNPARKAGSAGGTGGIIIVYYACTSPIFDSTSSMFLVF